MLHVRLLSALTMTRRPYGGCQTPLDSVVHRAPPYRGSVPCLTQNGAKSAEKIPALIVFGRIRSSNVNQSAVFIKKDAEAAKKAASDAGLSSFEVTTEEHQRAAAALPEGAIIAQQLARGETLTAEAVYLIDNGLATGRGLNVMAQGTRKEIIAEIMKWSARGARL
jgi:hypothetical protein